MDKVVVDGWGTERKRLGEHLVRLRNLAIGGQDRFYARCWKARSNVSGNKLQIAYGVMRPYAHLAPFKFTFLARKRPVMCSDVLMILDSFFRRGYKARVSRVELTFDVQGIPYRELVWEVCTRARSLDELEGDNGCTLYVGSTRAQWQAKIYERTYSVVRIEFALRSTFLRRLKINQVQDVYLLRRAPVWNLVSFRQTDQSRPGELPRRLRRFWEDLGHGVPPLDMRPSFVQRTFREHGVSPEKWIIPSPHERLLRRMQKQLIW